METSSKKICVCILSGGKSAEHEVSIRSARSIAEALDGKKYEILLVAVDKTGRWLIPGDAVRYFSSGTIELGYGEQAVTTIAGEHARLIKVDSGEYITTIDVFFPIIHGTYGEDGSLQGLLELLDVPYVGAGVVGSAVGMDKDVMKRLLVNAGLPVGNFIALRSGDDWRAQLLLLGQQFGFPLFVKPANMGSSIGVTKVHIKEELAPAIERAFQFDTKILMEEFIEGREIECSVLGNDTPEVSVPGEIIPSHDFYSYEAKYLDEKGAVLEIPAKLTAEQIADVQDIAKKAFLALECSGLARVDCFLRKSDGKFFVNEINTLPGFTTISMYPKLWEASGLGYPDLLDRLIQLATERHKTRASLKRSFT